MCGPSTAGDFIAGDHANGLFHHIHGAIGQNPDKLVQDRIAACLPILLIEQNVSLSPEASSRAYVLENGRICLQGPSAELLRDPHIETAYLGL